MTRKDDESHLVGAQEPVVRVLCWSSETAIAIWCWDAREGGYTKTDFQREPRGDVYMPFPLYRPRTTYRWFSGRDDVAGESTGAYVDTALHQWQAHILYHLASGHTSIDHWCQRPPSFLMNYDRVSIRTYEPCHIALVYAMIDVAARRCYMESYNIVSLPIFGSRTWLNVMSKHLTYVTNKPMSRVTSHMDRWATSQTGHDSWVVQRTDREDVGTSPFGLGAWHRRPGVGL